MKSEQTRHPDLLRRFVAAPYVFNRSEGPSRISIESNDLEIALCVRGSSVIRRWGRRGEGLFCKIIRDMAGPVDGSERTMIADGALRVLQQGRGTILIHDEGRSELLGFVSGNVTAEELVSSLFPALFGDEPSEQRMDSAAFTKK